MFDQIVEKILQKHKYDFVHTKKSKSTMLDVKNYLQKNKKNCIYLTDQQSDGKGQRGNAWHSPLGNIYCSISFDNFLDIKEHFLFSALIGVTIQMTLKKFDIHHIFFKWPNDVFYKKKKFAGIISEIININQTTSHVIIGFGINFSSAPEINKYKTTYLKSFSNIKSIDEFLLVFIEILFFNLMEMKKGKINELVLVFSKYLMFMNQNIKIMCSNSIVKKGIFRGINNDGSLKLEKFQKIENIYNGSIDL